MGFLLFTNVSRGTIFSLLETLRHVPRGTMNLKNGWELGFALDGTTHVPQTTQRQFVREPLSL